MSTGLSPRPAGSASSARTCSRRNGTSSRGRRSSTSREATFVEWTRLLPPDRHGAFINEVLDRYRQVGDGSPDRANVFTFYQMEVVLRRA